MNYQQSLEYLYGLQQFGIKLGLDNVQILLDRLGHPEKALSIVHIAGTNGKGSTAVALASILTASGNRTGLYTSPHLQSFTERIQIDGVQIKKQEIARLTSELKELAQDVPVTFFEFTTVLALEFFRRSRVDRVILETGLGGRLDATNAVTPELCLLTPISRDHQQYLGEDLSAIAAEKAGIIKPGVPVLTAPQHPEVQQVLVSRCAELRSALSSAEKEWQTDLKKESFSFHGPRWQLENLPRPLPGRHQIDNLGLALAAAEKLQEAGCSVDLTSLPRALAGLRWPGRLEWSAKAPNVLLDGAHNPGGSEALAEYLDQADLRDLLWIAAFKDDKSWQDIFSSLKSRVARVYCAPLAEMPSVDPGEVVGHALSLGVGAETCSSVKDAMVRALARAASGQVVLAAGSLFLVGEARMFLAEYRSDSSVETVGNVG